MGCVIERDKNSRRTVSQILRNISLIEPIQIYRTQRHTSKILLEQMRTPNRNVDTRALYPASDPVLRPHFDPDPALPTTKKYLPSER